jgi:hypothetical protein
LFGGASILEEEHITIQVKCKALQIKRGAHKYLFSADHPPAQNQTILEAVKLC